MTEQNSAVRIRLAREADMPAHCEIVNHYIETTSINFRAEPQTPQEWTADWKRLRETHPWLVAVETHESGDRVLAIAYACPWKPRRAYDWTVETTVYVRFGEHGRGIGRALYARLLEILDLQGFRSEIAVIALPNAASAALHEALGFRRVGTLDGVGYKRDGWRSTDVWQRRLATTDEDAAPSTPLPVRTAASENGTIPAAHGD